MLRTYRVRMGSMELTNNTVVYLQFMFYVFCVSYILLARMR